MQIIVLGAGVIGVTTAYFLAKNGFKVTVLEKNKDSSLGCSLANGGQLSYSHIEPWSEKNIGNFLLSFFKINSYATFKDFYNTEFYRWFLAFYKNSFSKIAYQNSVELIKFTMLSKIAMHQIAVDEPSLHFHHQQNGILHFYRTHKKLQNALKKAQFYQKIRPEYQIFTAEQCLNHEPTLIKIFEQKKLAGGIFFNQDESGDSKLFTQQLAKICQEKYQVKFLYNTTIENIFTNTKKITGINTNQGVFVADKYIYCLGAYSNHLLKGIKINSQIYPIKGYSLSILCDQKEFLAPQTSLTDNENKLVFSRIGNIFRVAGTLEMCNFNQNINKSHLNFLYQQTKTTFSHFGQIEKTQEWQGFRPFRPNGLPIIQQSQYPNLILNTGHGSLGFTLACGSAKILINKYFS
jgi:D-amino-acid dehydrogenase